MKNENVYSYIPTLNGWRALSIIYVLIFHASWLFINPITGLHPNEKLWLISKNGAFGVYFFFGISGYLITTRFMEENKIFGNISLKSFYIRRFFRIMPILLIYLALITLLKFLNIIQISSTSILSSIFFFRNYTADVSEWYSGHFWSLSMEEHYYLIWPTLFILIIKCKKPWISILSILGLVTIWRALEYRFNILSPYLPTTEFRGRTDLFFDYMMWGSLVAYLNFQNWFKIYFKKIAKPWMIYFVLFIIHLLFFFKVPFIDTIKGILIQLSILLTVNFPDSTFSKKLENKIFIKIGIYSYSLYIWQQLFFPPANQRISTIFFIQTPPLSILLLMIVAYLSFNFIENPAIIYGKKLLKKLKIRPKRNLNE